MVNNEINCVIDRIKQMEIYFEDVTDVLKNKTFVDYDISVKVRSLTDYYDSGQWLLDFECDERGELPIDLKRGVLSEDGLYNLLEECKNRGDMNDVVIRKAILGDEDMVAYIQSESWKAAFVGILSEDDLNKSTDLTRVRDMYTKILSNNDVSVSIQLINNIPHCIAGWSKNRCELGNEVAELICIHSLQDKWRKGYGSLMMNHILSDIKNAGYSEIILWVFEKNIHARSFYEKHGFALTGQSKIVKDVVEVMYSKKF